MFKFISKWWNEIDKVNFLIIITMATIGVILSFSINIESVSGITKDQIKTMDCNLFEMNATAVIDGEEINLRHVIIRTGAMSENSAWCFSTLDEAISLIIKENICKDSVECLSGKFDQNLDGRYVFSYQSGSSASSHPNWGPDPGEVC